MRQVNLFIMSATMMLASCGGTKDAGKTDRALVGKSDIKVEGKRMTPEAPWAMGRIGGLSISPDGKQIAYTVVYCSVPENKSNWGVFVVNADGTDNRQITHTPFRENEVTRVTDGSKLPFLSNDNSSSQLHEMNPDGSGRKQIPNYDGNIEGYSIPPDGKKILFIAQVKTVKNTADKYPDLDKTADIIITDLMYKHWDEWVTIVPHPFIADFDGKSVTNIVDVLEGKPYESPMKPWRGVKQLVWNTTSDKVAYTCRKKTGLVYAISTNSDIYVYDLNTKKTINVTEGMMGYDTSPQYSPDGKSIAWQSMKRDGCEADQNRLFIMSLETGERRFASEAFGSNVDASVWSQDAKTIYFTGVWHGETQIYSPDLTNDSIRSVTSGMYDYGGVALFGDKLITKRRSMNVGDEIYAVSLDGQTAQLTQENKQIYDQIEMGKVEGCWMKTTDGKEMLTWVIYPPQFDPNKKYPALLLCEGGPQSPVSQFWSYRWNIQIMAANGHVVVAPNRRGLPGFGVEWNEAISGDYGGQCVKGYFTVIDEMAKEPLVNRDHLGCVGASFGGFSVYWLTGHHDKRFKAFIAHDGIFNMEMQYLETEEKWFANWDMGDAYWEKQNPVARRTFANSPHLFVEKWDTLILCIHGEKDYRILANQAMAAFDATVMRGVPAELLIYPDENHWVLKLQGGVLWQRTFFEWLGKRLKPNTADSK